MLAGKNLCLGRCVVLVVAVLGSCDRGLAVEAVASTADDHRAMMQRLGIESLRPGENPNDPAAPNAVNYDEAKANPYATLPDPLLLNNGERVTSAAAWWNERRAEIVEDFDGKCMGACRPMRRR